MIRHPGRFEQAAPAGFDGLFDWDFLKPAWGGTKIEPMDWDGVVERRGHFLVFETKEPDKEVPLGQRIALEQAVLLGKGKIHVLILYGKTQWDIWGMEEWYFSKGLCKKKPYPEADAECVLRRASSWFEWVNRGH